MAVSGATTQQERTPPVGTIANPRPGAWIDHFDPEDSAQWQAEGRAMARRNLYPSIFAEFLGFAVWQLWTISTPLLIAAGAVSLTADQAFWLVSLPNLLGAALRLPYTFAVPRFGGRNWTIVSALLLLIPCAGVIYVVHHPDLPFGVILAIAATAGVGGGNFASSMANISFFFPEAEKGKALGLNAAGGNLGAAAVQFFVPLIVVAGAALTVARPAYVLIPLALLAAGLAYARMNNLSSAASDFSGYAAAARNRHTWVISFLYIGTFGSFIGYAGTFPLLLTTQFPHFDVKLAFLGALVGSLARPLGGTIADRVGGAVVSIASYVVMAIGAIGAIAALHSQSIGLFFTSFIVLFVASGIGNGAVYRMIPAIFRGGVAPGDRGAMTLRKRQAAACIGIAAAVGAFGGFLVPRGFARSTASTGSLDAALYVFMAFYVVCIGVVWAVYLRGGDRHGWGRI